MDAKYGRLKNYINGGFAESGSGRSLSVHSPLDGSLLAEMPCSGSADLDAAVAAARTAFPRWSRTPIKERVQVFFRYKYLLEQHLEELAALVSEENGKTRSEAVAEIE
jgi:malonate-semialdehyde dehydrogenase (acetylating)/methylmalonate-semialdehyde dehydrogenase